MSNPFRKQTAGQPPQLQIPQIDPEHTNASPSSSSSSGSTSPRVTSRTPPATTFRTANPSSPPPPPRHDDHVGDAGRGGAGYEDDTREGGGRERRRSKVVKKVRVLSPPPLSPDSPDWSYRDAGVPLPRSVFSASPSASDPFGSNEALPQPNMQSDSYDRSNVSSNSNNVTAPSSSGGNSLGPPPANPFSKTLEDMENAKKHEELVEERKGEGAALKAANVARGSLDVGAFKRLLMTGHAGHTGDGAPFPTSGAAAEEAALRISRDIEATRPAVSPEAAAPTAVMDGNESDSSVTMQIGTRKKAPPPPPSSRHGRSIKSATDGKGSPDAAASSETRPLPAEPGSKEETDTAADGYAKGEKLGEVESGAAVAKKPVPAPPPRRGHARMESKMEQGLTVARDDEAPAPQRSSMEATIPGRSNSVRHSNAPAPPPPRRLQGASQRPMSMLASPNLQASPSLQSLPLTDDSGITSPKQEHATAPLDRTPHSLPPDPPSHVKASAAAPPPPPARNTSVRRPPSVHSTEPASRRTSTETKRRTSTETKGRGVVDGALSPSSSSLLPPPPPPPARKRGNSKSSVAEGAPLPPLPPLPRTSSRDGGGGGGGAGGVAAGEGGGSEEEVAAAAAVPGHGEEILADLDALKREVDALRGRFH